MSSTRHDTRRCRAHLRPLIAVAVLLVVAASFASSAWAQDAVHAVSLSITKGLVSGPSIEKSGGVPVLRVSKGDDVEIRWSSDIDTELHLHGYNIEADLEADSSTLMRFEARFTGRYAIEMHGSVDHDEATIMYIEVRP